MSTEQWRQIERTVVLQLLRDDHPQPWQVSELEAQLSGDVEGLAVRHGIGELQDHGVAVVDGQHVRASRCARHLDALDLITV